MAIIPDRIHAVAKRFLHYSLTDIDYKYDQLTEAEKKFVTREEFDELVTWLKGTS